MAEAKCCNYNTGLRVGMLGRAQMTGRIRYIASTNLVHCFKSVGQTDKILLQCEKTKIRSQKCVQYCSISSTTCDTLYRFHSHTTSVCIILVTMIQG